jgi:uncharacterized protein (TIGR00725 family)
MGSGSDAHADRAEPLGRWLAARGVHLLTGAGGGVMAAVSRAFCEAPVRRGLCIGVVPSAPDGRSPKPGYPNAWIEVPLFTHLPLSGAEGMDARSRNHINVLSSNVLVALPGGAGTGSEVQLALDYGRPIVAFLRDRREIAGLPPEVQVYAALDEIRAFVSAALEELAPADGGV